MTFRKEVQRPTAAAVEAARPGHCPVAMCCRVPGRSPVQEEEKMDGVVTGGEGRGDCSLSSGSLTNSRSSLLFSGSISLFSYCLSSSNIHCLFSRGRRMESSNRSSMFSCFLLDDRISCSTLSPAKLAGANLSQQGF